MPRKWLLLLPPLLFSGLGCFPETHGCRRSGGGGLAILDLVVSTLEVGAAVAELASDHTPPPRAPPPMMRPPAETGLPVYGRLVSRDNGQPLAGVALALYRQGVWVDLVTSRPDGSFSFPHLYARGGYSITFQARPDVPLTAFELDRSPYFRLISN